MMLNLDKSDWKHVTLGDVVNASKERCDPESGSVERYVAGEHMDTDDLKIHRWGVVGDGYLGPAFHRRFHPGQVLYGSRRTYLRKVAVSDFDGVCANTTFVVETRDKDVLLQEFLPFIMTSERFHEFAIAESKGSVNPYVNWSDIARYQLDLPSLDEQKRIADLLWAVEVQRTTASALREATAGARQALVDRRLEVLLTERSVPFEQVWARSPEGGWSAAPVDEDTGRFVLSLAALGPEGYRLGHYKNVPDTPEVRAALLGRGDLLVSRANTADTVGRAGIFSEDRTDISFPDTMMRLWLKPTVLPQFAEVVLLSNHGRRHMRRTAAGSATSMVKINRKTLGRFDFPDVTVDAQREMLELLGEVDSALTSQDDEARHLDALRGAISAEIFGDAT
jgi:type I restriction enzyme, S subunit